MMGPVLALLLSASQPAALACEPIAGWDKLLADESSQWIVVGEFHGSNEMPEIFADAVCLTANQRPVVVAVEQPETAQADIDNFIDSDGGPEAQAKFLESVIWTASFKDGRSSRAYFKLFERLRLMRRSGAIQTVIAFQPSGLNPSLTTGDYEQAMADLIKANTPDSATVLVFVGNVHAQLLEIKRSNKAYLPMAAHLPADKTLTLNIVGNGVSSTWACTSPTSCGAITFGKDGLANTRGVTIIEDADSPYNGLLYLGSPTTASMPQIATAPLRE